MNTRLVNFFIFLLGLIPVLFFIVYVGKYTINIPFLDDSLYYTECLLDVNKSKSLSEAFWIFMKQHTITEHRTPISKFVAWLIYKTTGSLNYTILAHLGNLYLGGMLWLFWRFFKKHNWNLVYFLPIPFLIFQMQTFENQFWTICNWTYYPIGFLQMLVLYYLSYQQKHNLRYAILFAVLATFTFSNGMFVFLPALLVLLFQKRYKETGIFMGVGIACVALYFSTYKPSPIAPHQFSLTNLVKNFVVLLGDYADIQDYHSWAYLICSIVGVALVGACLYSCFLLVCSYFNITIKGITQKTSQSLADITFLSSSMICLILSGAAVAYSRYTGINGFEEMFSSRYKFISVTLLCLSYLFVLVVTNKSAKRVIAGLFIPLCMVLYGYSYYWNHEGNVNFRERLTTGVFNFQEHQSFTLYPVDNDWTRMVDEITIAAIKTGVYQLPSTLTTPLHEVIQQADTTLKASIPLTVEDKDYYYLLQNDNFETGNPLETATNLILKSDKDTYLLPIRRRRNRGKKDMLLHQNYFEKGFSVEILKNTFHPATYSLGLLSSQHGKTTIQFIQKIRIQ